MNLLSRLNPRHAGRLVQPAAGRGWAEWAGRTASAKAHSAKRDKQRIAQNPNQTSRFVQRTIAAHFTTIETPA
jgi:hypothetical protein